MSFKLNTEYNKAIDADTKKAWDYANAIFTSDENAKGLILMGTVGNGKTRFFQEVYKEFYGDNTTGVKSKIFTIMDANDIVEEFSKNGSSYLNNYQYHHPLVIDDLGSESLGFHYGKSLNVLAELITFRYRKELITHFTTNLDKDELTEKYGARIMDRIREMCTVIHYSGKSLRN